MAFDATPLTASETAAVPYSPSADVLMRQALARATAGLDPAPNLAAAASWAGHLEVANPVVARAATVAGLAATVGTEVRAVAVMAAVMAGRSARSALPRPRQGP